MFANVLQQPNEGNTRVLVIFHLLYLVHYSDSLHCLVKMSENLGFITPWVFTCSAVQSDVFNGNISECLRSSEDDETLYLGLGVPTEKN